MKKKILSIITGGLFMAVAFSSGVSGLNAFAKPKTIKNSPDVVTSATKQIEQETSASAITITTSAAITTTEAIAITTSSAIVKTPAAFNPKSQGAIHSAKGQARAAEVKQRNNQRKELKNIIKAEKKNNKNKNKKR